MTSSNPGPTEKERLAEEFANSLALRLEDTVSSRRTIQARIGALNEQLAALGTELDGIRELEATVRRVMCDAGYGDRANSIGGDDEDQPFHSVEADLGSQKSLILSIVRNSVDGRTEEGIRPHEIAAEFQRLHGKNIAQSVRVQVQRLSKEGKIRRLGEGWTISHRDNGPASAGRSSEP